MAVCIAVCLFVIVRKSCLTTDSPGERLCMLKKKRLDQEMSQQESLFKPQDVNTGSKIFLYISKTTSPKILSIFCIVITCYMNSDKFIEFITDFLKISFFYWVGHNDMIFNDISYVQEFLGVIHRMGFPVSIFSFLIYSLMGPLLTQSYNL